MTNIEKSILLLKENNYTCCLYKDEIFYYSYKRGVKPLVDFIKSGYDFKGFSAADKVIGKATAFLYVILGVKDVYANVISTEAIKVLDKYNIKVSYDILVPNIINRTNDGICPFELAVINTDDSLTAYDIICNKLIEMNIR